MNLDIKRLKIEAMESCNFRGHNMGEWQESFLPNYRGISKCKKCGKQVCILLNPLPNEIDIGGEAVAFHCDTLNFKVVKYSDIAKNKNLSLSAKNHINEGGGD